jgi:hypothetical protein
VIQSTFRGAGGSATRRPSRYLTSVVYRATSSLTACAQRCWVRRAATESRAASSGPPLAFRSRPATSVSSVVALDTRPRTQNGHIRNDTRDVSRRIRSAWIGLICRRNCAASDRACTRVTRLILHGKEGVDGSSPSEGSAKAPEIGAFSFRSICSASNVRWVWSPSWGLQVQNALSRVLTIPRVLVAGSQALGGRLSGHPASTTSQFTALCARVLQAASSGCGAAPLLSELLLLLRLHDLYSACTPANETPSLSTVSMWRLSSPSPNAREKSCAVGPRWRIEGFYAL